MKISYLIITKFSWSSSWTFSWSSFYLSSFYNFNHCGISLYKFLSLEISSVLKDLVYHLADFTFVPICLLPLDSSIDCQIGPNSTMSIRIKIDGDADQIFRLSKIVVKFHPQRKSNLPARSSNDGSNQTDSDNVDCWPKVGSIWSQHCARAAQLSVSQGQNSIKSKSNSAELSMSPRCLSSFSIRPPTPMIYSNPQMDKVIPPTAETMRNHATSSPECWVANPREKGDQTTMIQSIRVMAEAPNKRSSTKGNSDFEWDAKIEVDRIT